MRKNTTEQSDTKGGESLKSKIIKFFNNSRKNPFSYKELIKKLHLVRDKDKKALKDLLEELVLESAIAKDKSGLYSYAGSSGGENLITGRLDFVNPRFGYVIPITEGGEKAEHDIWISGNKIGGALDGDIVRVALYKRSGGGNKGTKSAEGEIVEVVERKRTSFVGRIEVSARHAFVIPDGRKMHVDIFVPKEFINGAKTGEKVLVDITNWPTREEKSPTGKVTEVLGMAGENETEMHAILAEFGLPYEFPETVLKAAEAIKAETSEAEIKKRRDMRDTLTFTIDPEDAKDFDDALSFKYLDNGNWEIGIHIADVSHYIEPGDILDKEAYRRATSVYLVDRCVPMLPERLSNELCSLRPNEDKLTFSAIFEIDADSKIHTEWFGRTIIHSNRRFSYEQAQEVLETLQGDLPKELTILNTLAKKMRDQRFKEGAISFETVEVKFRLDSTGKPLEVVPKVRKDAHKLIEEFMLLANKRVAEFVFNLKKGGKESNTMVYRTHDAPNPEKLAALSTFAKRFGHKVELDDEHTIAKNLNKLSDEVEGKPEQNVLQSLAIRTMSKAIYSIEPDMHFGLAFKHYSHFTSPIRRYPDVMAHRLLQHYLDGGKSADKDYYIDACEHSSAQEKLAAEAERSSIKFKQVEFMQSSIGKEFAGIVSGVTEFGMFVELVETKCEGMVRLADLEDDFYEVDMDNYRIVGKKNKRMITLGDSVQVIVKSTNLERRTIDLELVNNSDTNKGVNRDRDLDRDVNRDALDFSDVRPSPKRKR
ncbi:ribonuclease R [Cytophaga aurantiaca]|uniref:ribonuclease R n=1 Tax=Cytophaga aurantiaca TaxID=29530 RepID=UPI00036AF4BA|nr:ribonuclease R [Cytophaga aurantiaca]